MSNVFSSNKYYNTIGIVSEVRPSIINNTGCNYKSAIFLPAEADRMGEGGLRTKGFFKYSYSRYDDDWCIVDDNDIQTKKVDLNEYVISNQDYKMDSIPLISIITVVFNGEKHLEATIQSVLKQTYPNVEYVIIDGGSADGTLDIIYKYEDYLDYWVSEKDGGIYDAMNKGIKLFQGRYIMFLNAGDLINDESVISKMFETNTQADVYYGKTLLIDSNGNSVVEIDAPDKFNWKSLGVGEMIVSHQSVVFSRTKIQMFDLRYRMSSDYDWVIKALKKSNSIVRCEHVFSKYLIDGVTWNNYLYFRYENLKIIKEHFSFIVLLMNYLRFSLVLVKWSVEYIIKLFFPDFSFFMLRI